MTDTTDRPRVVPLRERPPLNDVPGQLRLLASRIESGEVTGVETALVVLERRVSEMGPFLTQFCYGYNPPKPHVIGLYHMAAAQRGTWTDSDDD